MQRVRRFKPTAAMVFSACLVGSAAHADALVSHAGYKIVEINDAGEETRVERNLVRPGETIEYALSHSNETDADLSGLTVLGPVPEGATLALGFATSNLPAIFEVQAEMEPETPGLEWSALPAFRKVIAEDGSEITEPVPAEAIEAVRWRLENALESGATALNTYRVVVD